MNYWGYRIDVDNREYFYNEIIEGRLRQGWGYDKSQDLSLGEQTDKSAKGNFPIYNKVKKGDILLIPRIESWDEITIVEATEDFNKGYKFSIDAGMDDYGHIFPVKLRKIVSRHNIHIDGYIRETLKCRSRFWNINKCGDEIQKILSISDTELRSSSNYGERFRKRVESAFNEVAFANDIYDELNKDTHASEWEYVLCEGFKRISPDSYVVETTSNRIEKEHGADIIIRIPSILNNSYIIAIQVKDYTDEIDKGTVDQICKSDEYFLKEEGSELIDKYLIIIRARSDINGELIKYAEEKNVKILFENDVKKLLSKMGRTYLGDSLY